MFAPQDHAYMRQALILAKTAEQQGEVPVGAVLVADGHIIGSGFNSPIAACDPSAHAEMNAIRQGAQHLRNYRLVGATLYVTLEPCVMCMGAILHARVQRVVYGARDTRVGVDLQLNEWLDLKNVNHAVAVQGGLLAEECGSLLTAFFRQKRLSKKNLSNHKDH